MSKKFSQEEFIKKCIEKHGAVYDYSLVKYVNSREKIEIICPSHGPFKQVAHSHFLGHGCRYCHYDKVKKTFSEFNRQRVFRSSERFIEKAQRIHAGRDYDYSLAKYTRGHDKITVICPKHGKFRPTVFNHLAGQICPECSESGFNPKKPASLYYLKIENGKSPLYKIGITNRKVENRYLSPKERDKIKILKTWNFLFGKLAQEEEKKILNKNKKYLYHGDSPLTYTGIKEMFTKDILSLDKISMEVQN